MRDPDWIESLRDVFGPLVDLVGCLLVMLVMSIIAWPAMLLTGVAFEFLRALLDRIG